MSSQPFVCYLICSRNSTYIVFNPPSDTYWGQFEEISKYNLHLSLPERMWAAWYAFMQNDVLATGIMSFVMHEVVYFGRSLPWIIIDRIPYMNKYKIQNVNSTHLIANPIQQGLTNLTTAKNPNSPGTMELRQTCPPQPLHRRTSSNLVHPYPHQSLTTLSLI
jgi:hypothetical protein